MNIVVGGTHGLGHEITKQLQAENEKTFVLGRSYNRKLHGKGARLDLLDMAKVTEMAGYISSMGDAAIKGFYWVSGYGYNGEFADQENPRDMALVNFANAMPLAQAAWRKLGGNTGKFVVVSSTTGVRARKDEAVYAATKHAQVGFARSLGMESEALESDISVTLVLPGGMQTPFWDKDRPASYDDFLEPSKVAEKIVNEAQAFTGHYQEIVIERGSL